MSLENVGKEDQGTYICLAQNAAGERKAAAAVRVRGINKNFLTEIFGTF